MRKVAVVLGAALLVGGVSMVFIADAQRHEAISRTESEVARAQEALREQQLRTQQLTETIERLQESSSGLDEELSGAEGFLP